MSKRTTIHMVHDLLELDTVYLKQVLGINRAFITVVINPCTTLFFLCIRFHKAGK
jgi:hypothetical protein